MGTLKEKIEDSLTKIIKKKNLSDKYVVVFGANALLEVIASFLNINKVEVSAVIDNSQQKQGNIFWGLKCYRPEDLLIPYNKNVVVLICSKYFSQMSDQLKKMGYLDNQIVQVIHMKKSYGYISSVYGKYRYRALMWRDLLKGKKIYSKIYNKYGQKKPIFIFPFNAIGDVYVIGRYLRTYFKKNNISDYIITVIGNGCKTVCEMYGYNPIEQLTQEETRVLIQFCRFLGKENVAIKILHYSYQQGEFTNMHLMRNYKELNFMDLMRSGLLGLKSDSEISSINVEHNSSEVDKIFLENNLQRGKTVIIAPYAKTIPLLPFSFWEGLSQKLIEHGYKVCTNVGKDDKPIKDTIPIFFSLKNSIDMLEQAGTFIGLRSGFCDVISSANCQKIILYQQGGIVDRGTVKDYFSLKSMGLIENGLELGYIHEKRADIITSILQYMNINQ